jgi:signal transduction histidine kinase
VAVAAQPPFAIARVPSVRAALVREWRAVGRIGRAAVAALVLAVGVAILLGVSIERSVRRHLLDVRTELVQVIADNMAADRVLPLEPDGDVADERVAAAVEHRLIGGDITGVVVRDRAGAVVYAEPRSTALADSRVIADLPHVEKHADGLLHFVVAVNRGERSVGTFEVHQSAASFDEVLARVRRNVWLSISMGLGSLTVAMGAFTWADARSDERRRRDVERLLRELLRAEDRERRRVVGALHDDVGQPLYRLLYGLEGCRARVGGAVQIERELEGLTALVRDIDRTLRAELHNLHRSSLDVLDLRSALEAIAADWRERTDLTVDVHASVSPEPPAVIRAMLVRTVEEALLNVRKHARASAVVIHARADTRSASVEVADDGRGPAGGRGLGLAVAAERLQAIGGKLALEGRSPHGTVLRASVQLPVEPAR